MALTHVKAVIHQYRGPLLSGCTEIMCKTGAGVATRAQMIDWLMKRSPPLSPDQVKAILTEFDKP